MAIDADIRSTFRDLIGKRCCRQQVGDWRSLSIGFGVKVPHVKPWKSVDSFYGEWEIGTYSAAWRIVHNGQVLCGSKDVVDSIDELDEKLQHEQLGRVVDIENVSSLDVRVTLDEGMFIDFLRASTEEDPIFHIFMPNDLFLEYTNVGGWRVRRSDVPSE
jgi:hypothetical protein